MLHHHRHGKRLCNIVIRHSVNPLHLAGIVVQRRQHDNGDTTLLADHLADGKSADLWKHQVQKYQIRLLLAKQLDALQTILR